MPRVWRADCFEQLKLGLETFCVFNVLKAPWGPAWFLGALAGHLRFLTFQLGIVVQENEITAPTSCNAPWHFFALRDLSGLYGLIWEIQQP